MESLRVGDKRIPPPGPEVSPEDLERIEDVLRAEMLAVKPPPPPAPSVEDALDQFFWREDEVAPGVPELLVGARAVAAPEADEVRTEWLTFQLGAEEYGLEIAAIREILKLPSVTEVPRAPAHILGVIMVRGDVIAVIDPRRRLGLPVTPATPRSRILVCEGEDGPRGLLVDSVSQVVRLPGSAIEPRPAGVGSASADYLSGIGRDRDRFFVLLDVPAILRDATTGRQAEGAP